MPKPIICLATVLCQFAQEFRPCFSKPQFKYFVTVLLALVECQERRTLSALLRCVGPNCSLSGLSRFFSKGRWSPQHLADLWLARFKIRVTPLVAEVVQTQKLAEAQVKLGPGRPVKTDKLKTFVTGFLIFDDSTHHKPKGHKMQGLGKHYSNCEKKVVVGHSMLAGLYCLLGQRTPLLPKLYRQKKVCQAEGVAFESKIDMVINTVNTFEPVADTATHVLVDSWFHCHTLRKACRARGWELSGGLKANRKLRVVGADGKLTWQVLSEYAAKLTPTDWHLVAWPSSSAEGEAGRQVYVHTVRTKIHKLGVTRLVITRYSLEGKAGEMRYWGSTLLEATTPQILEVLAQRWSIEVFFEDAKDLLGSDHYQLMSVTGLVGFWTLLALLSAFLDEHRFRLSEVEPGRHYSWGECRNEVQSQHRRNLLGWLEQQFRHGASSQALATYLGL